METLGHNESAEEKAPENLDDLFMELFPPEFLENLPPGHIEAVINKLKLVESGSETIPPEWLALRNVLQKRGFLDRIVVTERS